MLTEHFQYGHRKQSVQKSLTNGAWYRHRHVRRDEYVYSVGVEATNVNAFNLVKAFDRFAAGRVWGEIVTSTALSVARTCRYVFPGMRQLPPQSITTALSQHKTGRVGFVWTWITGDLKCGAFLDVTDREVGFFSGHTCLPNFDAEWCFRNILNTCSIGSERGCKIYQLLLLYYKWCACIFRSELTIDLQFYHWILFSRLQLTRRQFTYHLRF